MRRRAPSSCGSRPAPEHGDDLRHDRDHHAGAGHHHRQRRAALHAGHAVGLAGPDQLGADLLHRRRRDHDRAGRLDRQPLRPQAHLHRLLGRLHHRLRAVRAGAGHQPDGAVPPAAGRVRRGAGAAVAGGDARLLRAARARQGDVDLGHGRDDGADHGPVTGRLADRNLFLALGVLRQSAVRHLHRARADRSSWTRPRRTSSCASTGSASPRSRSRIGSLQLALDRGEQLGWLESNEIIAEFIVAGVGFYYFFAHSFTTATAVHPVRAVQGQEFRRRLRVHGGHGPGAVLDHGAVLAVPAERDRLSHHHRRACCWRAAAAAPSSP